MQVNARHFNLPLLDNVDELFKKSTLDLVDCVDANIAFISRPTLFISGLSIFWLFRYENGGGNLRITSHQHVAPELDEEK